MSESTSETAPAPAIPAAKRLARPVSYFRNKTTVKPTRSKTAKEFLDAIRCGRWKKEVEAVRGATDKTTADKLKRQLPAIAWSGMFERRNNGSLLTHSGLLCLDLDGLGVLVADGRRRLVGDSHVLAVFLSPSGAGLKATVPIDALDADTHCACFRVAEGYFKEKFGLTVDPACKDVARLCFVSFDADAWISGEACAPFILSAPSAPLHQSAPTAYSAPSAPLCTTAQEKLERRAGIQSELGSKPRLARIYRQYVESRTALPGKRNQFIVQVVPALYEVVDEPVIVWFSLTFYDLNRAFFKDGRAQHETETRAMLKNYRASYRAKLSAGEQAVYEVLDDRGQAAFRICRDLAKRGKGNVFFLSCDDLAARVECDSRQAHRLLCAFNSDGLIEIVAPGIRRAQGVEARATEYLWKL
jgi:hypothetical protein